MENPTHVVPDIFLLVHTVVCYKNAKSSCRSQPIDSTMFKALLSAFRPAMASITFQALRCCCHAVVPSYGNMVLANTDPCLCDYAANGNSMPPPSARVKADDDDIFGDAGTDYVCELPKVRQSFIAALHHRCCITYACYACHT